MYAIVSGPRTSPTIPKKKNPPIVPISPSATGRVDRFERKYGLNILSIEDTNMAP